MQFISNKAIIEGCLRKDQKSWSFFVDKFAKVVYWAINDRLSKWNFDFNQQDVDDIFQEIFLELWQKDKLAQVKDEKKIIHWLTVVAANYALNYMQRKGLTPDREWVDIAEVLIYSRDNPAKTVIDDEQREIINSAVANLGTKEKLAVKLRIVLDKKYEDIAKIMNLPLKTVFSIVNRAKVKLRQELQKKGITKFEEKW